MLLSEIEAKIKDLLLSNEASLTAVDIAKKIGLSKAKDVEKTLDKLRKEEILSKEKVGRRVFWMIVPVESSNETSEQMNQKSPAQAEVCTKSPNIIDSLYLVIENLQKDVSFLREQVGIKDRHIDCLLDLLDKNNMVNSVNASVKSGNKENLFINPIEVLTEAKDYSLPKQTPEILNIDTPFLSPKKTSKRVIENQNSDIVLNNKFGGLWVEESDDINIDIENLDMCDSNSIISENSDTMYSDVVQRNLKPSVHSNNMKLKSLTSRFNLTNKQANTRRPQVVVNAKPETESFKSALHTSKPERRQKPTVAFVGDSMIKWATSYDIRSFCNHAKRILVRPFLGACINDLYDYLKPVLKDKPQVIVLHVATNDTSHRDFISTDTICDDMELLIAELNKLGIIVVLSLPINRNDEYGNRIKELNIKLRSLCSRLLVNFIDNDNIKHHHLNESGYHLNKEGTYLLCENVGNFLEFLIPKCFYN